VSDAGRRLAPHQVRDDLEFFGVHISVPVQVEHLDVKRCKTIFTYSVLENSFLTKIIQ
jgi:hypothetical protein